MFLNKSVSVIFPTYNEKDSIQEVINAFDSLDVVDELIVSEVRVDEGPTMKRIQARAKGRANRIFKRSCHVSVTVGEL